MTKTPVGKESPEYRCEDCTSDFSVMNEPSYRGLSDNDLKQSGLKAKIVRHCPFCGGDATEN